MIRPYLAVVLLTSVCVGGCNDGKPVEETNGVTTDRYFKDKEGRRNGEFRRYFGKDTLAEVSNYVHGLLDGVRTIYNKEGNIEITETYVRDTLQGPYTVYYDNGDVKVQGNYDHGIMRGVWKRYYEGGKLLESVTYDENVENGPFTEYYDNGNLRARGTYLNGDFEQDSLFLYNESGILERLMLCDNGICHTIWTKNPDDTPSGQ